MNVQQLINILSEMSPDADVALFIDRRGFTGLTITEGIVLELDDVVIGESYIGFKVSPEFYQWDDE